MTLFSITKLEAARRQIETAARLYFNDSDSISIHTLTEAGRNVLRDLAQHKNIDDPRDDILNRIKPEYKKEFALKMRAPQNFFKHADKDPENELSFNPEVNELGLLYAILLYKQFSDEVPFYMKAFIFYYMIHNPDAFLNTDNKFREFAKETAIVSKPEFIRRMQESQDDLI